MGGGILPTCIHNGKLYFLFGKENQYEDSAPGFSDFGGGTDKNESFLQTAIREGGEELTGFLGTSTNIRHLLTEYGTFNIDYNAIGHNTYRTHIFPYKYNDDLVMFYNNNQHFLQKHLDKNIIRKSKIFEKQEIKWFSIEDIIQHKKKFRSFFQNIIDTIYFNRRDIYLFIKNNINKK